MVSEDISGLQQGCVAGPAICSEGCRVITVTHLTAGTTIETSKEER